MEYSNFFTTKNPQYAALLLSMYQTLDSYYFKNGECYFVFAHEAKCKKVINDYLCNRMIVSAKSLFDAMKTINGLIKAD